MVFTYFKNVTNLLQSNGYLIDRESSISLKESELDWKYLENPQKEKICLTTPLTIISKVPQIEIILATEQNSEHASQILDITQIAKEVEKEILEKWFPYARKIVVTSSALNSAKLGLTGKALLGIAAGKAALLGGGIGAIGGGYWVKRNLDKKSETLSQKLYQEHNIYTGQKALEYLQQ